MVISEKTAFPVVMVGNDNSYPIITLITVYKPENDSYSYSFRKFDEFMKYSHNMTSIKDQIKRKMIKMRGERADFELNCHSVPEQLVEMLINKFNYTENFLLNRKIIDRLENNLALDLLKEQERNRNLYHFSSKILGWFLPPRAMFEEYLSIYLSFGNDFRRSGKKNVEKIFWISITELIKRDLFLWKA